MENKLLNLSKHEFAKVKLVSLRNDIKILKQQISERWMNAFDEFNQFKKYEAEVVEVKYSHDNDAYNIQDYKNGKLKSNKKLFNNPPGNSYCEFGLNKDKLPVISIIFKSNVVAWIGFYKWNKNTTEYIEFCYSTKVPSSVQKISIHKNKKRLQSISLKERGNFPIFSELNKQEIIDRVFQYPYTFLDTKICDYVDERISKSFGIAFVPGMGEYAYEDVYSYDDKSSLSKIERFTENWPPQLIYIKPSGKSIEKLIDDLSNLLADAIINALDKEGIEEPIFNVQLNYHALDNYWPYIVMITDKEKGDALLNKTDLIFIGGTPVANEILRKIHLRSWMRCLLNLINIYK
ncbi:hypothetical protein [Parafilimonas terrae]|uniref:hypothetical protein n=1 Tax=Parafilimonas terrae TaxID=1465490 RepID=UPI000B85C40A|nr:hypothetical protein [Parafilimonas terrae]